MIFLIFAKNGNLAIFGTRSWEGLTARGGLDGPHLGHPLRRDQVRGSPHLFIHKLSIYSSHSPIPEKPESQMRELVL